MHSTILFSLMRYTWAHQSIPKSQQQQKSQQIHNTQGSKDHSKSVKSTESRNSAQ